MAGERLARMGRGSVHHVAFRAVDDAQQEEMAAKAALRAPAYADRTAGPQLLPLGVFAEPGGILFEIATDQPGFAVTSRWRVLVAR